MKAAQADTFTHSYGLRSKHTLDSTAPKMQLVCICGLNPPCLEKRLCPKSHTSVDTLIQNIACENTHPEPHTAMVGFPKHFVTDIMSLLQISALFFTVK